MPPPTQKSQQSALKIIPNTPEIMNSHLCDYLLWTPTGKLCWLFLKKTLPHGNIIYRIKLSFK